VWAGVRKSEDAERLQADLGDRCHPVMVDVTNPDHIQRAIVQIQETTKHLDAVVNNAGVAFPAPLEFATDLMQHMAVNVQGAVALTQAALPLLRQRPSGRIVFVGSIGGRSSVPFFGAYCASKFALEGIADAWRVELAAHGIHVSIIEPGAIDTPIWQKTTDIFKDMPDAAHTHYGGSLAYLNKVIPRTKGIEPQRVVDGIYNAMTAENPKARYVIGRDAWQRVFLEKLPRRWRDALMARSMIRQKR